MGCSILRFSRLNRNARVMASSATADYIFLTHQEQNLPKQIVIAVVDDDASVREALTGLMKSLGYRVIAFQSGEEFLNSKHRSNTACLIADVQMGGMSGPELHCSLVTAGHPIPTILITAYPDEGARMHALQAGVKGYLSKPFSEEELLGCIRSALDTPPAANER
jgi:FixJ family two-component response regulator